MVEICGGIAIPMACESIFYYRKAQHGGTAQWECHKSAVTCDLGAT